MLSPKAIENGHFLRLEIIEDKIQGNFFLGSLIDNEVFTVDSNRFTSKEEASMSLSLLNKNKKDEIINSGLNIVYSNILNSHNYGIFRNSREILEYEIIDAENSFIGSFEIKCAITFGDVNGSMFLDDYEQKHTELFSGVYHGDLKHFIIETPEERRQQIIDFHSHFFDDEDDSYSPPTHKFDFYEFINAIDDLVIEKSYIRCRNIDSGIIVLPNTIPNERQPGQMVEFLTFENAESYFWAGPFFHEGHMGCHAKIRSINRPLVGVPTEKDFMKNLDWYSLPYSARKAIGLDSNKWYRKSAKSKKEILYSLPIKDRNNVISSILRQMASYYTENTPVVLYLYGNDDCSYSKYVSSIEEAESELALLRAKQPLRHSDIHDSGFIFTN